MGQKEDPSLLLFNICATFLTIDTYSSYSIQAFEFWKDETHP